MCVTVEYYIKRCAQNKHRTKKCNGKRCAENYQVSWKDMGIEPKIIKKICEQEQKASQKEMEINYEASLEQKCTHKLQGIKENRCAPNQELSQMENSGPQSITKRDKHITKKNITHTAQTQKQHEKRYACNCKVIHKRYVRNHKALLW